MKKSILRLIFLMCSAALLSACFGPSTPQAVTKAFWESVIDGNAGDAVKYSTLTDPAEYDGFSRDWSGFHPSWGKVIIDGDEAKVVSKFSRTTGSAETRRKFVTYLVRRKEGWKVDYARTRRAARGGVLGDVLDRLGRLSDDVSKQLKSSADDFNDEMDHMSDELASMSDSLSQQASEDINRYAEELRKSIKELAESVNRALTDESNDLSDKDKRVLKEVAANLDSDSDELAKPTPSSLAESSKSIGDAQQQLESISSDLDAEYKRQWVELSEKSKDDMRKLLDGLSSSAEGHKDDTL